MTYWGARPKIKAVNSKFMTPKKKETFSRVRTTRADCHVVTNEDMRVANYAYEPEMGFDCK